MGLDPITFLLEVINFLVLFWLLTRFLYRPIQEVIRRRQEEQEAARQAIATERARVEAEREGLAKERARAASARDAEAQKLAAEMVAERDKRMAELDAEVRERKAQTQARAEALEAEAARRHEEEAVSRAEHFLRSYMERMGGPELEQAIIRIFLADLATLAPADAERVRQGSKGPVITVATAYGVADAQKREVEASLRRLLGRQPETRWEVDREIVSGIRARLDGHVLEASLTRGLDAFRGAPQP
jgi:F-type H+-transporting ATPase subunit b